MIITVVGGLGYMATQSQGKFDHHGVLEEIHHNEHDGHLGHHSEDSQSSTAINKLDTSDFLKVHSQDPSVKSFFTQFRTDEIYFFPLSKLSYYSFVRNANTWFRSKESTLEPGSKPRKKVNNELHYMPSSRRHELPQITFR